MLLQYVCMYVWRLTCRPSRCSQEGVALRLFGSASSSSYPGRGSAHSASGHQQLPVLPLCADLLQGEMCISILTVLHSASFQQTSLKRDVAYNVFIRTALFKCMCRFALTKKKTL